MTAEWSHSRRVRVVTAWFAVLFHGGAGLAALALVFANARFFGPIGMLIAGLMLVAGACSPLCVVSSGRPGSHRSVTVGLGLTIQLGFLFAGLALMTTPLFPIGAMMLVTALLASVAIATRPGPRFIGPGVCGQCGYDVSAITGRSCPECGTTIDLGTCAHCGEDLAGLKHRICPKCGAGAKADGGAASGDHG